METEPNETLLQTELINAAKGAVMLYTYVCRELDAEHPQTPNWSASNPAAVMACMSAAAQLDTAWVLQVAHGIRERFK